MISVLLVGDEPELLKVSCIFLEREGDLQVNTVTSAPKALEVLEDRKV